MFDLGVLGCRNGFPRTSMSALLYKKKRNLELSAEEEKEYNVIHATKRIVLEHTICRMKKFRILEDIFRNRLRKYNKVSDIV